ncbi:MAG: hypothetical protein EXR72_12800 [Myxococcales bacterium]|nr:hypothetical protein [Myxococcales bacterium]
MIPGAPLRLALRIAGFVAIALTMIISRVLWSSRVEWQAAEERLAAGDAPQAIDRFGRAARLYAPGNPWSSRALDRLEELAVRSEKAGDRALALVAWREVRSSVLATRAIYTPNRARLAVADERIATLAAALESPSVDPGADEPARRLWHAERLARTEEPSPFWSLCALAGFAGWLAAAVGFLFRAVDERDRLRRGPALRWALGVIAGMALFLVGLAWA